MVLPRLRGGGGRADCRHTEPLLHHSEGMKWTGIYFLGYAIMIAGILAALWKWGILQRIGAAWTIIGLVIAIGIGIMIAVAGGGKKETIRFEK